jgi:Ulp1 family protease
MPCQGMLTGYANASKRKKQYQNCLQVALVTKFVERDGIVLCEKDWKKLYSPKCRAYLLRPIH